MSFLTEYLRDRPDRLPDRETLRQTLADARDYGHARLVLAVLAEHDRIQGTQAGWGRS
jgi:hypothetical protein